MKGIYAANRFGFGLRPEQSTVPDDKSVQWLVEQLSINLQSELDQSLPTSGQIMQQQKAYRMARKQAKMDGEVLKNDKPRKVFTTLVSDTFNASLKSANPFTWRLLDFFSNHFSVSAKGPVMVSLSATLEREAIMPNLSGRFEDLLLAVIKHPAMLIYLNNERSFGNNSRLGKRGKGLNENLAREILELHTLGVDGGYTQQDVIELANGISGWSVNNKIKDESSPVFAFRNAGHEPGHRTVLNNTYKQRGIKQGEAILKDLANQPNTAQFLCTKIARHFISDNPSQDLVKDMVQRWHTTGGNITEVMKTLVSHDHSWLPDKQKFKTPREFILSSTRLLGVKRLKAKQLNYIFRNLGQAPFQAGAPDGYSDYEQDWNAAASILARADWSHQVAKRFKGNIKKVIERNFAESMSNHSKQIISRAESRSQAMALLLMSPEFLRR